MKIINNEYQDFHIHSFTFSDGMNSVDEIVKFAGEIGLKKIAITDHCQAYLDGRGYIKKCNYSIIKRWQNIFNDVEVIFGIESDLLNEDGDVSMDIQGESSELLLLSSHPETPYSGDPEKITLGYLNAIEKYHNKISFLAHPCSIYYEKFIDIHPIIELCNKYEIPMELNCANLANKRTNLSNLKTMLKRCEQVYINSDGHTLYEIQYLKKLGYRFFVQYSG
jgi:histidinol phosphatase-like PHP family hydrolase